MVYNDRKNIVYTVLNVYSHHEIKMYTICFQKCTFLDLSRTLVYVIQSIKSLQLNYKNKMGYKLQFTFTDKYDTKNLIWKLTKSGR